ncbi:phage tail-collar fiber domain-containing protein [Enterobacter sp. UPMP2052]
MAEKYYSILTNRGKELEAQSSATGKPVIIKDFVVGDGNGQAVKPDPAQTKLVREVYRNTISALQVSPDQANQFIAQLILPVNVGGFVVREVGLLTDAGELYSIANSAAIEKPENGVSVNLQYRLAVSESANIELKAATGDGLFLRIDKNLAEIAAKGEAAQKSSREAIGVLDATTARKGLVQLSSATDNSSEALAATPKAVKAANDNANGRVPSGRKINGHDLTRDTNVTAQDIFNGQAVAIGNSEDLNAYSTPGLYYQPANAQAQTGKNYPEANAGSLEVYKHAGITQIYRIYNGSRAYIRTLYSGTWSAWTKQYDAANKPTAGDVGAVAKAGDAMTGKLTINIDGETILLKPKTAGAASYIISRDSSGANHWYVGAGSTNNADTVLNNYKGGNNNFQLKADGSVTLNPVQGKSVIANGPVQIGGIGNAILNIGDNDSGLRSSKDGQVDLWANGKMFGYWNTTTFSFTGQIIPTNYSNFDARYYTKAQSDAGYMSKTGAYTKAESDSRFQPKGSYTPAGQAYTKAQSDSKYPTAFRVGSRVTYNGPDFGGKVPQGAVNINNYTNGDNRINGVVYAYLQFYLNGKWVNFS